MKKLLLSSLLGGFVVFVWMSLSWTALGLHPTLTFKDDAAVAKVLAENATAHGIYLLPGDRGTDDAARDAFQKGAEAGPFGYMMIRPGPAKISMGKNIALSFASQVVFAFLITSLLLCARPLGYGARVWFVVLTAMTGGLLCHLPPHIWWEVPASWVMRELLDLAVGWTLGGLVIAKFATSGRA